MVANLTGMLALRTAHPNDVDRITAIVNAAFEVERPMRFPGGHRTSAENVRDLMARDTFLVAEQDGRVVGSVFVRITGATGYFGMLAVDPSLQKSGIGRALREHAEAYCKERGCTRMTLSTGDFRTELVPYYRRAGYNVTAIEPGPTEWSLAKPFKVVHMEKPL